MTGRALSPSPIALFLMGLAERGADGSVEVGGRQVVLSRGQVIDVRPAEGDGDLVAFLRDSGRVAAGPLESCAAKARSEGVPVEEVILRQRLLSDAALGDVRRGLWLDRLVRGMARASAEGREPSPLHAVGQAARAGTGSSLVTLVLDALERRAAIEDAGIVGAASDHAVEWLPSSHLERARRWSRFGAEPSPSVATLLMSEPAAAPRIAALVRAGLARIVSPHAAPAPPPRHSQIPVTAPTRHTPPLGSLAMARSSLPPTKLPKIQLDPGLAQLDDDDEYVDDLPAFAEAVARLDDPLDDLERQIASLEQGDAPGPERAAAWKSFGEAWEARYGAIEEAARAYREAAAADSEDAEALHLASDRCAAIGQADLAVAYARASVSVADEGPARARAYVSYALLCRRLGKLSEALGAARAASDADPTDGDPAALAVHLWWELGRADDAAESALEAAGRLRASDPARALSLVAIARELDPANPAMAEAYAAELARNELIEASIAVRADAVRRTSETDVRRALLLAAAEQAEGADRPALAAALLTRAFDREPSLDVLYEPLDADLSASGATLERAVILEEVAAAAPEEARATWLVRAAQARLDIPGDGAWEAELRTRALELEPEDEENLGAIREASSVRDDPRLLADALERALTRGRWSGAKPQAAMLEELARVAEDALEAPMRARWAWERLAAIDADSPAPKRQLERLVSACGAHRARSEELERELKRTIGAKRTELSRRLAEHLRDDPERRRRAVALYREVVEAQPDSPPIADALERLLRLEGDEYHEAASLRMRAEHVDGRAERLRILNKLAALHVMRRDLREAAIACRHVLEEVPGHREASIRLRRAACRLRDRDLLREALASEAQVSLPAPQRARVLTALALELELAGSVEEAISCAEAALVADSSSAEAALLVARHLEVVEEPRAALGVVRALFGDAPPILEAWARVARESGEREIMNDALDAWANVAPFDAEPWAYRLAAFPTAEPDDALAAAVEGAIDPARIMPRLARGVAQAVERLGERDAARAASLAVRAADAFGPAGDALRELASRLADAAGDPALRRDALERRAAALVDAARIEVLREIAQLHQEREDRAAEARTHLRILAEDAHDPAALARLQQLYAETGETERLMAVLTLELEGAGDTERTEPLLRLAVVSARLQGDLDRAEGFLRDVWSTESEDDGPLLAAAGGLVALGRARRAVEMLREAGRELEGARAAKIYRRAAQIALAGASDPRLALAVAVEGLDRAPSSGPLLLVFEQLAIELKDVDAAERVYHRLIERAMGPHGRRSLAYRRARWLERAAATRAALTAYLEAFEVAPQAGALYSSIERLARELGDLPALVQAATVLSERAAHPAVRASMAREAARLLEHELAAPERAFEILLEQWKVGGDTEIEADLGRLAGVMRDQDPAKGEAAFEGLLEILRKRTEDAWMGEAKARLYLRQGRIHAVGRSDLSAATAAVEEGLAAVREEGGADPDLVADLNVELAAWLHEGGNREAAEARIHQALGAKPNHRAALTLGAKLGLDMDPADVPPEAADPFSDWGDLTPDGGAAETAEPEKKSGESETQAGEPEPHAVEPETHAVEPETQAVEPETQAEPGTDEDDAPSSETDATEAPSPLAGPGAYQLGPDRLGPEQLASEDPPADASEGEEAEPSESSRTTSPGIYRLGPDETLSDGEAEPEPAETSPGAYRLGASETVTDAARPGAYSLGAKDSAPELSKLGLEPEDTIRDNVPMVEAPEAPEASSISRTTLRDAERPEMSQRRFGVPSEPPPSRPSFERWSPGAPPSEKRKSSAPSVPPPGLSWVSKAPVDSESAEALERQALLMLTDPSGNAAERALELMLQAMVVEPERLSLLGPLRDTADRVGNQRASQIARGLLALFDPTVAPPEPMEPPLRSEINDWLYDSTWSVNRELWRLLFTHALPLLRQPVDRELLPNERVTRIATSAVGRAFSDALASLRREDFPLFHHARRGAPVLELYATAPPTIYGAGEFAADEPSMRFALGRAVELALPEHILLATLPVERARLLVESVTAAFGPPDREEVSREAASFAADLWRTVPSRGQAEIGELLKTTERWNELMGTRTAVLTAGDRAGLLAAGSLAVAVRVILGRSPEDEADLAEALRSQTRLRELAKFAYGQVAG